MVIGNYIKVFSAYSAVMQFEINCIFITCHIQGINRIIFRALND